MNGKDFPFIPTITHYEYQFCFHDMYFILSSMFQFGVFQLLLMKYLLTWTHNHRTQEYVPLQCQEFHDLLGFIPENTRD
jgi:hypothetical protein